MTRMAKRAGLGAVAVVVAATAATLSIIASPGTAASAAPPQNTARPTISGTPEVGSTLTTSTGTWTGSPTSFTYQWSRCAEDGTSCAAIGGATARTYTLRNVDAGNTLRARVYARNADGVTSAASAPTPVIRRPATPPPPPATGCPPGAGPVSVDDVRAPARLVVDRIQWSPSTVSRSSGAVDGRYHIVNTCGQSVRGALVYSTAVPFNQVTAHEVETDNDGWATIRHRMLRGFPAARNQQLLVFFVRARKPGDNLLSGISGRRLVSVRMSGS
jgi:hypothetical protein